MTGIIVTIPPTVEVPPGNNASNPSSLPPVTYTYALLNIPQTWTATQTFPAGNISLNASDISSGTLAPARLPITGVSTNVQSSGVQGIQDNSLLIFNTLTAANPAVAGFKSQYTVSYTTLHAGASYPALWGFVDVQAGVQDSFYGLLGNVYNRSNSGEQVGGYLQGWKYADGQTWAAVTEARDLTGNADPTQTLTAIEADIFANGTDANKQRIGVEVVIGKHNAGGVAATATYGFRLVPFNLDLTQGSFTKGLSIEANVVDGIDLHTVTAAHSAMWLADGQKILFDTAGTRGFSYSGTVLSYTVSGTAVFNLVDNGALTTAGRITSNGGLALAGSSSGTTNVNASAAASGTLTLPAATDTLVGKATTDTFTNKTFDTAGTGNSFSINGLPATANTGTGSVVRGTSPTIATPNVVGRTPTSSTVTISNASPGVVTWTSHGLVANAPIFFSTSGTLPTGLTAAVPPLAGTFSANTYLSNPTLYYVKTVLDANTFTVSATLGGAAVNTSSAGSGTHTAFANAMVPAGCIGEYIYSVVPIASSVALVSGSAGQVWNTISLGPGIWWVGGNTGVIKQGAGTPVFSHMHASIVYGFSTIASSPFNSTAAMHVTSSDPNGWEIANNPEVIFLTATTTINAVITSDFTPTTANTAGAYGKTWAVRIG